jgi:hypothetical protein
LIGKGRDGETAQHGVLRAVVKLSVGNLGAMQTQLPCHVHSFLTQLLSCLWSMSYKHKVIQRRRLEPNAAAIQKTELEYNKEQVAGGAEPER